MSRVTGAALLLVITTLAITSTDAQLQINRNTDDCVNPPFTSDDSSAWRLWPNTRYMISGTSISRDASGNYIVTNRDSFRVTFYTTYKVVENLVVNEVYVLYHCGTPRPTQIPAGAKLMEIPLRSVSADDSSALEYMKECGVVDRIAYVSQLAVSSCMQALAVCGYVAPDPAYDKTGTAEIDSQVDAYFTFGAVPDNPKSIAMSAPTATSPLGRAEWLRYVSLFFNREWEAETLVRFIRNDYNSLKRAAQATAAAQGSKPVVAWIYKGFSADFVVTKAPYKVAYVEDAGGAMIGDDKLTAAGMTNVGKGTWSLPQSRIDVWRAVLQNANVIITEDYVMATGGYIRLSQFMSAHQLLQSLQIPAINTQQVYSLAGATSQTITAQDSAYRGSVGMDWFERGTARCDEVLRDFINVLTPATVHPLMTGWNRKWLLKLSDPNQKQYKAPIICDNDTAKLNNLCQRTSRYPARVCPNTLRNCDPNSGGCLTYPKQVDRCTALDAQKRLIRQRKGQCPTGKPKFC